MQYYLLSALVAVVSIGTLVPAAHATRHFDETTITGVSTVMDVTVSTNTGTTTFWVDNLVSPGGGCGADPVMHVTNLTSGVSVSNDDCNIVGVPASGLEPCVRVTTSAPTTFRLIVHASQGGCDFGTGDVFVQSPGFSITYYSREFGGQILTAAGNNVVWDTGDRIHVVRPPNHLPSGANYRAYVVGWPNSNCTWNGTQLLARADSGRAGGVETSIPVDDSGFCKRMIVIGTTASGIANRSARLYINDSPSDGVNSEDTDGDNLGNLLENELGTCRAQGWITCAYTPNSRDTDHDGLPDDVEVLGNASQALPRFGADPLHKDAFFEIDQNVGTTHSWVAPGTNPLTQTILQNVAAPFTQGTNASMENPSGNPGLHVHFDVLLDSCVGSVCCSTSGLNCSTLYGKWGGATLTTENENRPSAANDMATNRRGLFFHGLLRHGGGGSSDFQSLQIGDAGPIDDFQLGFAHEMGHCFNIDHTGARSEPVDLVCKPNYRSILSYTFSHHAPPLFLSEGTLPDLVSSSLNERKNFGLDFDYLDDYFGMVLDPANGGVDWNRNGIIDPPDVNGDAIVTGVTAWGKNGICQPGKIHENQIKVGTTPLDIDRRPATAEFNSALHAFFVRDTGTLSHTTSTSTLVPCTVDPYSGDPDGSPDGCCPVESNGTNGNCNKWNATAVDVVAGVDSSPAATSITTGSGLSRIALVYSRTSGGTRAFRIRTVSNTGSYGTENTLSLGTLGSSAQPDLVDPAIVFEAVTSFSRRIHLYYLDASNQVRRAILNPATTSSITVVSDIALVDAAGSPITSLFSPGAMIEDPTGAAPVTIATTRNDTGARVIEYYVGTMASATYTRQVLSPQWTDGPVSIARSKELNLQVGGQRESFYPWAGGLRRIWAVSGYSFPNGLDRPIGVPGNAGLSLTQYKSKLQMTSICPLCGPQVDPDTRTRLLHRPFASAVFPFVERDTDDFATIAENLCRQVTERADPFNALCQDPAITPPIGGPPMPTEDQECYQ